MPPTLSIANLRHLLGTTKSQTDLFLVRFLRLLQTSPDGAEPLLCTLQYTLTFLHAQLVRILTARYERLAISIANKASQTMLPGEALVATIEAPHLKMVEWCKSLDAARGTVEDVRMFGRLVGLVKIYARTIELHTIRDPSVKILECGKIVACSGFQVLENMAFLVRRGVLRGEEWEARGERFLTWSWRFWMGNMILEMLRLWRVRQMRFDEDLGAQSKELEERWWRDVYSILGWTPATVVGSGWYGDEEIGSWSGLGGMLTGGIALRAQWKSVA